MAESQIYTNLKASPWEIKSTRLFGRDTYSSFRENKTQKNLIQNV
jgi:hypothetical protein